MGYKATTANQTAVVAWTLREGGGWGNAAFNPINTTQGAKGATPYNTIKMKNGGVIHVWNYTSCEQGIKATADTLNNGHYDDIKHALKTSADPSVLGSAKSLSVWGSFHVGSDLIAQARKLVG